MQNWWFWSWLCLCQSVHITLGKFVRWNIFEGAEVPTKVWSKREVWETALQSNRWNQGKTWINSFTINLPCVPWQVIQYSALQWGNEALGLCIFFKVTNRKCSKMPCATREMSAGILHIYLGLLCIRLSRISHVTISSKSAFSWHTWRSNTFTFSSFTFNCVYFGHIYWVL